MEAIFLMGGAGGPQLKRNPLDRRTMMEGLTLIVPTPEQLRTFVGPRADYYLRRWQRLAQEPDKPLGFNWAAFWLGLFWLLYRKMYGVFWITVGVVTGITVLESLVSRGDPPKMLDSIIALATATFLGTFGTHLYYIHARRRIASLTADGRVDSQYLAGAGGVSWVGVSIFVALCLAVGLLSLAHPE
jgi:hypothetical protein